MKMAPKNCAWAKEMLAKNFRARSTSLQPLKKAEAADLQQEKLGPDDLLEETAPKATGGPERTTQRKRPSKTI